MDGSNEPSAELRSLNLRPGYDSGDRLLEAFYVPALSRAVRYDRSVGYFRSSSLAVAARGLTRFLNGGGTLRLLCGVELTQEDRRALLGQGSLGGALAERLADRLATEDDLVTARLQVLAWMARAGRLQVRIAVPVDAAGLPVVTHQNDPYFHEKIGVLHDAAGDGVAFQGSVNESATAWTRNFESFSVYASWDERAPYFRHWKHRFKQHWDGHVAGFRVYELPEAARQRLLSLAPREVPDARDPEEQPVGDDAVVARYLAVAPRLVSAEGLAEATVGVVLFPHQRQVVARLAGQYPRSWLVADEVGLGKTISAGLALRRLLLAGQVRSALILAPANVCRQWQDELFEKFGLWVPRLDAGQIHGAHPSERRATGPNAYAEHRVLIASSHLARRPAQQELLLAAAPYDLLIVDEAHHARRNHADDDRYRPGRLLQLLDKITDRGAARAVWLLTATPMQVTPVELRDLLVHTGLHGQLADEDPFLRYFRELAKDDDQEVAWTWLGQALRTTPRLPYGPAERAVLAGIRMRLGPVETARVERFGVSDQRDQQVVDELSTEGRDALRRWLHTLSPVGQHVTRHSRETLKQYRAQGLLQANLAERDPESVLVTFTSAEQALYDRLDDLLDRLMQAHGSRRGAGFVLTIYRRRLTSSWAAIRATLTKRLARQQLSVEEDLLDDAEDAGLDTGTGRAVNDAQAIPLTDDERTEIRDYLDAMAAVDDSKFTRLRRDLDTARGARHSTIVFTQFTDTLTDLRDRLVGSYQSELATFTGAGGQLHRKTEGWVDVSKRDLVDALDRGQVTVLIATDAASEGLNLQSCSYLVNYDMPWNPMRVEQRIGRIDRLGQQRAVVHVRSYFIPHTVEQSVYNALARRIDLFSGLLGNLQPILGATERAMQSVFRAPRSERKATEAKVISELLEQVDGLERDGLELPVEDPLPVPTDPASPVTLADLRAIVADRFAASLESPGRAATWEPLRASRDPQTWTALCTYGHPRLTSLLDRRAGQQLPDGSALVLAGVNGDGPVVAVRADRTPPVVIGYVAEIDGLGEPTARGEAETLADRTARSAAAARTAQLAASRDDSHPQPLAARFLALAREAIAHDAAHHGDADPDAASAWHRLTHDATSPWAYADGLRQRLGVSPADLFTGAAPAQLGLGEPSNATQRNLDEALARLTEEYRQATQ
jgi:superfamily II DNA or RNA helicase